MMIKQIPAGQEPIHFYFHPGTRAVRVQWMLEELGVEYETLTVDLLKGAHKKNDYLAIHPLGKVPAVRIGNKAMFESVGICVYLADCYAYGVLAPTLHSPERAEYYQWIAFASGTLEPAIIEAMRYNKAQELGLKPIDMGPVLTLFNDAVSYIERSVANKKYLIADSFSTADLMVCSMLLWADTFGLLSGHTALKQWVDTMARRPAYQHIHVN